MYMKLFAHLPKETQPPLTLGPSKATQKIISFFDVVFRKQPVVVNISSFQISFFFYGHALTGFNDLS